MSTCAVESRGVMSHSDRQSDTERLPQALWQLFGVTLGSHPVSRLHDVTAAIQPGVTAVIGPSGAGKTSLLNLLVRFERPDGGELVSSLGFAVGRREFDWVPADFGLWPHLSVREHLRINQSSSMDETALAAMIERFGLGGLLDARLPRLSQGERSRLAVARALVSDAQVLVIDEPLVHVDPVLLDTCWGALREHCRSQGTSLVFSSHAPDRVLREATHALCLDRGKLMYSGDVDTLYRHPPSQQLALFLGPANWFESSDCPRWLPAPQCESQQAVCLRPQEVELVPDHSGPLILQSTTDLGSTAESLVRSEHSQECRTVHHRPWTARPTIAGRVALRLCAVLCLCLIWCGCRDSAAGPAIDVSSTRTIHMVPDGINLPAPRSLTVSPDGELYVLDNAGRVLVYDDSGTLDRQWTMPEFEIGKPEGICILSDGRVAVADTHYARVVIFDRAGHVQQMFGDRGEGPGQFIFPVGIARDDQDHLYVAEYGGHDRIQKFTADGEFLTAFGTFGVDDGQFQRPSAIVWCENVLYVADAINNRVQKFTDAGEFLGVLGAEAGGLVPLEYPYDIALGAGPSLYVVEYGAGRVTQLALDGTLQGRYGMAGRGDGQFWTPWGLTVNSRGRIYIADTGNRRIVELSL